MTAASLTVSSLGSHCPTGGITFTFKATRLSIEEEHAYIYIYISDSFAGKEIRTLRNESYGKKNQVPEEVRSGLSHHRDEVNAVGISHYASVVSVCVGPFAIEVPFA